MIEILIYQSITLLAGFILDCIVGDPEWMPHSIRLMGKAISFYTGGIRKRLPKTRQGELLGGGILVVLMLVTFGGAGLVLLIITYAIHPLLSLVLGAGINYQMLAMKDLKKESMQVYQVLLTDDIEHARKAVSRIVGRDTDKLGKSEVIKATLETVAENTSDGVIAPVFYLALGGPIGGILYKAVNTMDSMVGYRNEEYLYFGKAAAKLDDVLNFIPSRIAACLMILASGVLGLDRKNACYIYQRDRYCHASPNSAQTEAVMAGALGVQLAGDACYFGKLYQKPTIGEANREMEEKDILTANRLLYLTAFFMIGLTGILYGILYGCMILC